MKQIIKNKRKKFFSVLIFLFFLFFSLSFFDFSLAAYSTSTGTTTVTGTVPCTSNCGDGPGSGDSTPPAAVNNLSAGSPTATSITLTWTAPSDPDDTVSQYIIKYSANAITEANWAAATTVASPPTPKAAGLSESFLVKNLSSNTTYYFALKSADSHSNWSAISSSPSAKTLEVLSDTTPPAAVINLAASLPTATTITLTWTAPGNDGNSGTASQYSIRYSTSGVITETNWNGATVVLTPPTPQTAGSTETFVIQNLTANTTYYFALKTADSVPLWSSISNSPSAKTLAVPDITPPEISGLEVQNITGTSAKVVWTTNEAATSTVVYGKTSGNYNLGPIFNNQLKTSQSLILTDLTPNTTYYFIVKSGDASFNEAASAEQSFKTLDTAAPIISDIQTIPHIISVVITWKTNKEADSQVVYGLTEQLGTLAKDINYVINHSLVLNNLKPNTKYYFAARSAGSNTDQASSELLSFTTLKDPNPPANVSNLKATAGNSLVNLSWGNPPDSDFAGVTVRSNTTNFPQTQNDGTEIYRGSNTIYHHANLTNGILQYYSVFAYDTSGNHSSGALVSATPSGSGEPPQPSQPPQPPPPPGGGNEDYKLNINNFNFSVAKGKIKIADGLKKAILGNRGLIIDLDQTRLKKTVESFILNFNNNFFLFNFNETTKKWATEIVSPTAPGIYQADIMVTFQDKTTSQTSWQLEVLPLGQVYEKKDGIKKPVAGVMISLLTSPTLWPAEAYGQTNPQVTGADGSFGFLVPPGKYILKVEKEGYHTEETGYFDSDGVVINKEIEILTTPPKLGDVIKPGAPLAKNIKEAAKNLGEKTVYAGKVAQKQIIAATKTVAKEVEQFVGNPIVQETTKNVVAPTITAAAAAGATASVGLSQFLLYLRFLFTQPLLLFRRRKRRGWGVVYNSLTKMPLDLVIIRLVNVLTGRVVQSRVTDKDGRYSFLPNPGGYRLEINLPNFVYPSSFLSVFKEDGIFIDLYHGETIEVKEKGAIITPNVPLDPVGAEKPISQILWKIVLRRLQHTLSIVSLVLSLIFFLIIPSLLMGVLLAVQVIFYGLFLRLAIPSRPKSWGIIYDENNRKPIQKAIVRIFDNQYNKLLETQITDNKGRYSFLVGRNIYYLMSEKDGYEKRKSNNVDLTQHPDTTASLGVDMGLKPRQDGAKILQDNSIEKSGMVEEKEKETKQ